MTNCTVDIYRMTGSAGKAHTLQYENVAVFIVPASTEMKAMYGEMPSSAMHSYKIEGIDLDIRPETKFIVKTAQRGGLAVGETLITIQHARKTYIAGRYVIIGECNRV